jgi:geranylgeranyl diphosphate synthase type I
LISLDSLRLEFLTRIESDFHACMEQSSISGLSVLRPMIDYHYASGGKRLRALAVLWARATAGGLSQDSLVQAEDAIPFAVAVEMIHNATLIHDDLQDGDELRRGNPTLWKKFSPAQAINCGDVLFFEAMRVILESKLSDSLKLRLQSLIARNASLVIEGQAREFALKETLSIDGKVPTRGAYETMVQGKTAALFSMPLLGGAMIAGADKVSIDALELGAAKLGLAFQIQDDYIDLWGAKGRGLQGSDIAEGKLSYPALLGFELLKDKPELSQLRSILNSPRESTKMEDIEWVISSFERMGVRDLCRARIEEIKLEVTALPVWGKKIVDLLQAFI